MAYVNVAEWSPEHVSDWLKGLDDEIQPYTQFFVNNSINGCHLLTLLRDDLFNLNITKIGHQELVLEAVDLLKQLHYNLTSETLQSLALKLGCKAQSLHNHLKHVCKEQEVGKKERVSTETLSAVSDILNLVKSLISWLDRYPFLGQEKYVHVRKAVLKLSVELASTAQRDQFAEEPHKVIKDICSNLSSQSDKIVQEFNDSLIIQPAVLEVAKIKRKADDDVGIHINSSCTGTHVIESIKFQSPAYRCGKVEDGDEIVQVNYQTVVGWQVRNIICAMKEHPSEVHLTLKKRPRHPNVLGQVITLWPYRIPSKKTALKLYKWNKIKAAGDINDICPKSPEIRCDINDVPENYNISIHDKERQLLFGRTRSRLRRRATITGISPTALQPPISLDDIIGNSSKKKQSVGRAVSYDPGKVGNVDDSVFNDTPEAESSKTDGSCKTDSSKTEKESSAPKNQYLKPPTDKYLGSCLRRQKPVTEISPQNEISDIKLLVDFAKADSDVKTSVSSESQLKTPPSVSVKRDSTSSMETPRPKLDWLGKQKAKLEGMSNGNSIRNVQVNQKPRASPTSSCPTIETNPSSTKTASNTSLLTREGRPLLAELKALKRAADSKMPNEKVDPHPRKNIPSLPRQNIMNKRITQQHKLGSSSVQYDNAKENELKQQLNGVMMIRGAKPVSHHRMNPDVLKYSVIPEYPYEMHESKIVSLKQRPSQQQPHTKIHYVSDSAQNGVHHSKKNPTAHHKLRVASKNSQSGKPSLFNPAFGRSRSYNDIAFSSDSSSYEDDDDDEVYEEIDERRSRYTQKQFIPPSATKMQSQQPDLGTNFAAKVAEVYYLLNQGHCFPAPPNGSHPQKFDPASSAFIDELAKRMYHALQQDRHKGQNLADGKGNRFVPPNRRNRSKSLSREQVPPQGSFNVNHPVPDTAVYGRIPQYPPSSMLGYPQNHHQRIDVCEKPVELSPPVYYPNKQVSPPFKSATSQEILSLYTSHTANKSPNGSLEKKDYQNNYEHSDKLPIYESLPFCKANYSTYSDCDGSFRIGQGNQSIMFCPAERESESIKCNDRIISSPSDGWKYFDKGMFQPIREETSLDEDVGADEFVPLPKSLSNTDSKPRTLSQTSNEVGMYFCQSNNPETRTNGDYPPSPMNDVHYKDVPPSISSLVRNIPKPPTDDSFPKLRKNSDAQTDTNTLYPYQQEDLHLGNDDSFCTQNSDCEHSNFTRSSSLSSSSSNSTISSTNSSYYYADASNNTQFTTKLSISSENDSQRSPSSLPTMGISMLSKKRPSNSGGSDSGCNSEPHQQSIEDIPAISALDSEDECPTSGIITDVEHTI